MIAIDVFDRRIGRRLDTTAPFDMANAMIERYVLDDFHNGLVSADGGNVVLDFVDPDVGGAQPMTLSKRYLYGEAVDQLLAQEDLSKTLGDAARNLWPLVDHLATVRDVARQDGTIAAHYKYDSFGRVTSGDTSKTRYLFTSREFDPATALQYNRARWYDSRVGRWLSEDPLGFAAGDGNLQRYVGNLPTMVPDPSGLEEPAFYRLRRESQPGDWFYPGRNPGEGFWEFCLRCISLTGANPSFQNSIAIGGPGSNFGGALNQNLVLKSPIKAPKERLGNRAGLHMQLREGGFAYHGTTKGGYVRYRHPDGSDVWIRPNGEVIRTGPTVTPSGGGKPYNPRIDENGNPIDTHNPGEFVDPIPRNGGGP